MKVVDLSHTLEPEAPTYDNSPCCSFVQSATVGSDGWFARDFHAGEHSGTHLDAPAHFADGAATVDEIASSSLIAAAVVLDVRGKSGESGAERTVDEEDVLQFEKKYGRIPSGSVVCALTGWARRWGSPKKYRNEMRFPGFSLAAVKMLVEQRGVRGLGIDTLSIDPGQSDLPCHKYALPRGVYFLENMANLDQITPLGYTLVIGVLKLKGGSGSPARILAMKSSL